MFNDLYRTKLPPVWVDSVDEIKHLFARITKGLGEVGKLYSEHVERPAFDKGIGSCKEDALLGCAL